MLGLVGNQGPKGNPYRVEALQFVAFLGHMLGHVGAMAQCGTYVGPMLTTFRGPDWGLC